MNQRLTRSITKRAPGLNSQENSQKQVRSGVIESHVKTNPMQSCIVKQNGIVGGLRTYFPILSFSLPKVTVEFILLCRSSCLVKIGKIAISLWLGARGRYWMNYLARYLTSRGSNDSEFYLQKYLYRMFRRSLRDRSQSILILDN